MNQFHPKRREIIQIIAGGAGLVGLLQYIRREQIMVTLYTFGDSILDCGRYNEFGVHPGQLLIHNNDRLFPEFHGQDLQSRGTARLEHRARDGATVVGLESQAQRLHIKERAIALIYHWWERSPAWVNPRYREGITAFANALDEFVQ